MLVRMNLFQQSKFVWLSRIPSWLQRRPSGKEEVAIDVEEDAVKTGDEEERPTTSVPSGWAGSGVS